MPFTFKQFNPLRRYSQVKFESVSDSEALLSSDSGDEKQVRRYHKYTKFGVYGAIVCLYTVAIFLVGSFTLKTEKACPYDDMTYSPANEAIAYERKSFSNSLDDQNVFKGQPREELHKAWHSLLQYSNIRVHQNDLVRINRTSVPLNDEKGGFLATLDVFHQIHCLNVIREQVYREFYPDKHSKEKQFEHVDHCIDMLRQVLMCHGDLSVQTYSWIDDYRWPWPNFHVDHTCRKWDRVMDCAEHHYIPSLKGPILSHPTLGVSYRGDEGQ